MSIAGKVALVTGGGKGIGRAIALRLARDGADVATADLDQERANAAADDIRSLGHKSMVNNAGIAQVQTIEDVRPADLELIQRINVGGVLWGIQALISVATAVLTVPLSMDAALRLEFVIRKDCSGCQPDGQQPHAHQSEITGQPHGGCADQDDSRNTNKNQCEYE